MQDLNDKLTVLHTSDEIVFSDLSMSAFNFFKGTLEVSNTLYVGFRKPINCVYFGVQPGSPDDSTLEAAYWNGTTWTSLALHDETEALAASGFVRWQTPADQSASAIDGKTLFWVRLSLVAVSPATLTGIGPLLCSEEDLNGIDFALEETTPNILKAMVAARNLIAKEMQISPWDLLNIPDVSDAATFLSLYNIYFNQSDRDDDHYAALAKAYLVRYEHLRAKLGITIDKDDNGVVDNGEKVKSGVVYLER